ncbi:MAG TPA: histidine kinase [Trebonia sp.]|nr:histidine kinase [Trebonia sp.]
MGPNWLARLAAARYAPAAGVGLLAGAAVAQAMGWAAAYSAPGSSIIANVALFGLLALASTAPLIILPPVPAAITVTAANVLAMVAFGTTTVAGMAAQVIAAFLLGSRARDSGPRRGWAQLLAVGLALPFLGPALAGDRSAVLLASLVPAAAAGGIAVRARREADAQTGTREVLTDTLTQHMARGERARIARELHDVVAHHISMIAVQAETARLTTPGLPAAGTQRFAEIGDTARAGLTEMRRLLGVLREDADATVADRHPQPGLPQLAELIDTARDASGTGTRLIVSGPVAEFDPGVELAAYRIVQEALTNARRHAPGAAVDVELRYGDDALRLRIRDNGPGPSAAAAADGEPPGHGLLGHGLLGMRERALAVGGSLRTGAAPGGGFCVEAVLPAKREIS